MKRNKMNALVLSVVGVLAMTASLASCNEDPDTPVDPIDPIVDPVDTALAAKTIVEFDDDYLYQADSSKYFAPYIVRSAYFDDDSMPVIDFISSKDQALMKSDESAKLYAYSVQDDYGSFGTLVLDSEGKETSEVVISSDGTITCPTVTSRKDFTVYLFAGEDEESIKAGKNCVYKAIHLTVVPESEFASNDYVDLMSKPTAEREAMAAELEKYMYKAGLASIAITNNGSYQLYSSRVKGPFIDGGNYIPGYGYGILTYSYLSEPLAAEQVDEYKMYYHSLIDASYDEGNFNYLNSNSGNVSTFYGYVSASYYDSLVNEDASGSEYQNNLAREEPIAVEPDADGASDTWKIKLKVGGSVADESKGITPGLQYRTATQDATLKAYDKTNIKIEDYLTPFKLLATGSVGWYRGEEQAGESTLNRQIKGYAEYYQATKNNTELDSDEEFSRNVGVSIDKNDNSITIQFNGKISKDYAEYQIDSLWSNPISEEFVTALGDGNVIEGAKSYYGKTKGNLTPLDTMLSVGPYYTKYYESKKTVAFAKNELWPKTEDKYGRELYRMAGIIYAIDAAIGTNKNEYIEKFKAGLTDVSNIPADYWDEYATSPLKKKVDGDALSQTFLNTWDLAFWNERFAETIKQGKTDWEVKPCLSNENFYKALILGINRQAFADYYHSNPDFTIQEPINKASPKAGTYNGTQVHKDAINEAFDGKLAYDKLTNWKDYGAEYFEMAIEEELAAGHYKLGTESNPTMFTFTIVMPENVESMDRDWKEHNTYWTECFNLAVTTHVGADGKNPWVGSTGKPLIGFKADAYKCSNSSSTQMQNDMLYNGVKIGNYDGQGYWYVSGNNYDVLNALDKYKSDDTTGFTLNYGADTTIPSSTIKYDGKYWSFDSLWAAANSGTFIDAYGKCSDPLSFDLDDEEVVFDTSERNKLKLTMPLTYLEDYISPNDFQISVSEYNSTTKKVESKVATKGTGWSFADGKLTINFTGAQVMNGKVGGGATTQKYYKFTIEYKLRISGKVVDMKITEDFLL